MKTLRHLSATALLAVGVSFSTPVFAADFADIIVIADESGSMSGEHAWLGNMITQLNTELIAAGVGNGADANRFALVGYGSAAQVGGRLLANFGSAGAFSTATGNLVTTGGTEDGYSGIDFAFDNLTVRGGAALNVILVTDEDRDVFNAGLTYANTLAALNSRSALLNVVVNNPFSTLSKSGALGMDSSGNAYFADGVGGYTSSTGGIVGNGAGTTEADYVAMAFANGGAAWDLNLLRAGGLSAQSFTEAFIDIKVGEIIVQPPTGAVPEPSTYGLMGCGALLGVVWLRRRRAAAAAIAKAA